MPASINIILIVSFTSLFVLWYNRSVSPTDLDKNMVEDAYAYCSRLLPKK